jgi:phosphate transport system permease protein
MASRADASSRGRGNTPDRVYGLALKGFGILLPVLFLFMVWRIAESAWPAIQTFGWGFITSQEWNPVLREFGALPFIFGTVVSSVLALAIAVPLSVGLAIFLTELAPLARRAGGLRHRAAGRDPSVVYGLWGIFVWSPSSGSRSRSRSPVASAT